jgi:LemA protein
MFEILITLLVLVLVIGVWLYNRLVRNRNLVKEAWAGIDVQLQKRAELVPNLVQTVKAEEYPDLKASEGFQQLHNSLVEIEEHLQFARRYYNGAVRDNNNLVESFPSNIIAGMFKFSLAEFFEIELASQRSVPDVEL